MTSKGITGGLALLAVIAVAPAAHGQQQPNISASVADDLGPQTKMPVPDLPEANGAADPPVRLTRPNRAFLTGQEIAALFSNTARIVDTEYEVAAGIKPTILYVGGCPPVESFSADGRWTKAACHRVMRVFEGRWTTENVGGADHLCVEASDYPKQCRLVWQGRSPESVFLEFSIGDESFVNPYRLQSAEPFLVETPNANGQ